MSTKAKKFVFDFSIILAGSIVIGSLFSVTAYGLAWVVAWVWGG